MLHLSCIILMLILVFFFLKYKDIDYDKLKNELNYKLIQLNNNLREHNLIFYNDVKKDISGFGDKLYPMLNRIETPIINNVVENTLYTQRRYSSDTFHPMAIVKEKSTHKIYYLMGRQKYQNSNRGEFYLVSPNLNNATKIPLSDEPNERPIKDYYVLPTEFKINNGIFAGMSFDVQELKNSDLMIDYY